MQKSLIRIGHIAVFCSALVMANAHWAVLQTVAWSGMLVTYSIESGVEAGIKDTFSGDKPCGLCCIIEEAKAKEQTPDQISAVVVAVRLLAVASAETGPFIGKFPVSCLTGQRPVAMNRMLDPPPVPPPRAIPA